MPDGLPPQDLSWDDLLTTTPERTPLETAGLVQHQMGETDPPPRRLRDLPDVSRLADEMGL